MIAQWHFLNSPNEFFEEPLLNKGTNTSEPLQSCTMSDVADLVDQIEQAAIFDDDDNMSSVSGSDKTTVQMMQENQDAMLKKVEMLTNAIVMLQAAVHYQTVAASPSPIPVGKQPSLEPNLQKWNIKISETGLFKLNNGMSVFSTNSSRLMYVRILRNFFYAQTEDPDYDVLFDPTNNFMNLRELLLLCPVPMDHAGFYINNPMRMHQNAPYISPNRAQHALMMAATPPPITTFTFGADAAH